MCGPGPPSRRRRFYFSGVVFVANFPLRSLLIPLDFIASVNMGKKEEDEVIRIAKKMDKMAQKKNGVRCVRGMNAYLSVA